ncbi:hypothetical protein CJF30_00002922 [Rutstroemia sp. NJR-2017a BBW]|nr:hypothetical protein CJF30_00002922 [Rutstroemia sp. NJR-2017a BBW]
MDQWLRPVFQRTRTPVQGPPTDCSDDIHEADDSMSRLRPSSRVSSYINSRSSSAAVVNTPDTFRHIRIPENVYHKPSGNQMAETLKVVMMTRNLMDPVPVEYNTCILHVLEAYHDLQEQLDARDREIEELRSGHTRDVQDFENLAERWMSKEKDYQKELKSLEVLLSKKEGGMEDVSMARTQSVVHGSQRAADIFEDGLDKIKKNSLRYSSGGGSSAADWNAEQPDKVLDKSAISGSTSHRAKHGDADIEKPVRPPSRINSVKKRRTTIHVATNEQYDLTKAQLDAFERKHAEEEMGVIFDSSTESDDTSLRSISGVIFSPSQHTLVRSDFKEKPLPEIPRCRSEPVQVEMPEGVPWVELGSAGMPLNARKGFSFRPGDDTPNILYETSKDTIRGQRNCIEHLANPSRLSTVMTNDEVIVTPQVTLRSKLKSLKRGSVSASTSPGQDPNYLTSPHQWVVKKGMERGDSSSSIITAVRDNSGRSDSGRPKTVKHETAVMAAVRAIAASNKSAQAPAERVQPQEFYTREGLPFKEEISETSAS